MSQPLGKTIQIFLPDGNPRGAKIAEFTSRTVQAILVPRAHLPFACSRPELAKVGLYFLLGESSVVKPPLLYIGEAEDCVIRLKQQNKRKDWWETAIACVSKTAAFTKSHVKYLEWHCHTKAFEAERFKLENSSIPTKSYVSEPMEADLKDHFDTIRILTGALGFPLFDKIQRPQTSDILTCKGRKANALGEYTEDGMVVFAGSTSNRQESATIHKFMIGIRQELLKDGILEVVDNETLRFTKNHVFPSPSQAAAIVLARSANGWLEWKYPDGRTLDEVKRKAVN
jgi:Domain of unknown function (DUF4357)